MKRKSTESKRLAGTHRPDRDRRENSPAAVSTRCPADLPDAAKRVWRRLVPALASVGRYADTDRNAARDLCLTLARLHEAEALLDERGLLVDGARGGVVRNPAAMLAQQYRQAFYRWCAKFGLTPLDRGALGPADDPGEPSLRDLLQEVIEERVDPRK